MKKIDIQRWVNGFKDLEADSQLEIVEEIIKELHLNEEVLGEDGYNVGNSSSIRKTLKDYISVSSSKEEINDIKSLVNRFNKLDKRHKFEVIKKLIKPLEEVLEDEEESQLFSLCEEEGHVWGHWKSGKQTITAIYNPPDITDLCTMRGQPYSYDVPVWIRTCKRCGCEEVQEYDDVPEEVKERKNRQKIK